MASMSTKNGVDVPWAGFFFAWPLEGNFLAHKGLLITLSMFVFGNGR